MSTRRSRPRRPARAPAGPEHSFEVGADVGGTFTDIVLLAPDGGVSLRKVPSSPDDFARAILAGLTELLADRGVDGAAVSELVHATTVATNAILERRGARTALITTRGFRDVLELRRARAPHLYDAHYRPPPPLVERRLRLEVDERMGPDGTIVRPLGESSAEQAIERIRGEGVESVAVCLLHSFRNPAHELAIAKLLGECAPEVYCSTSVDVLPEIGEYERTSTTVINAYIGPLIGRYLVNLRRELVSRGIPGRLRVMQSNGGILGLERAATLPVQVVESGPAAGVVAAARLAARRGAGDLISMDVGGTTAKASLIEHGRPSVTTEYEVGSGISLSSRLVKGAGYPLRVPVLDIAEVGAGGGSIARVEAGILRVGPESAGAVPGPACYDTGGGWATVTDANVVLGYLNPTVLAGGSLRISSLRAHQVIAEQVAAPLGLGHQDAAHGVFTVAVATMARAVKAVSTYRGRDPRDFALLAFGGMGPLFGVELARFLGIRRVIVPPAAGLFSAIGLLAADEEHHVVQSLFAPLSAIRPSTLAGASAALRRRSELALRADGGSPSGYRFTRQADLRYRGQAYDLTVSMPTGRITRATLTELGERFELEHERTYGHRGGSRRIDLVSLRLIARSPARRQSGFRLGTDGPRAGPAREDRVAYFGSAVGQVATRLLGRAALGVPTPGPVIVEEYDSTTLIPPGCLGRLDADRNIEIEVNRGGW